MSVIGEKMFTGAAMGAGIGALGGGITGAAVAHLEVEQLPTDTVHLQAYDKPTYDIVQVGIESQLKFRDVPTYSSDGSYTTRQEPYWDYTPVTAKFPKKYDNGSVQMEHVPERNVTQHGKGITWNQTNNINEPSNIDRSSSVSHESDIQYRTIGQWQEPKFRFETGVNTFGYILAFGTVGALLGAVGGALLGYASGEKEEAELLKSQNPEGIFAKESKPEPEEKRIWNQA